ncbi:MAG: glycine--tRNA ligase subunit beta [Armatimonadetes bacterium]|nr:glycine--tRNA ligase subunit beta [Armatimonadota bacterium]
MKADLLLEIGVEEIPAGVVLPALEQLRELLQAGLGRARLEHGLIKTFGTPRRLVAYVSDLATQQPDVEKEFKGPPVSQAFDADGKPTKAAQGFAQSRGVPVEALEVRETEKGAFVFARVLEPGRPALEVLPEVLEQVVAGLTFPKTMRWGDGEFRFCRPVRWIVALLGEQVIPVSIAGVQAGSVTRGHRQQGNCAVSLSSPAEYEGKLRENLVVVDEQERQRMIRGAAAEAAASVGGRPRLHDELVAEVAFMLEYPTAVLGRFDERFLDLPTAVVVKVLEGHQRFFAVEGNEGRLLPYFIAFRDGGPEGLENVRRGYEWVVEPRLEDAEFYMREDLKRPLAERIEDLKRVVFMAGLGTLYDKTQRLVRLVEWLGRRVEADRAAIADAVRAAELSKCDLVSMMIADTKLGELQGIVGAEYALRSGELPAVCQAIAEQYAPRGADDQPPQSLAGRLLATADRLDNLVACYALGLRPSGSADPYALRRQMQGLIAIAVAGQMRYALPEAVAEAYEQVEQVGQSRLAPLEEVQSGLAELAAQRMDAVLQEAGVRYDLSRAVNSAGWTDFVEAWGRAVLLQSKLNDPEWEHVVLSGQRVTNILRPARDQAAPKVDEKLLVEDAEFALAQAVKRARSQMERCRELSTWEGLWEAAVGLAPVLDKFFDDVLVMHEDAFLRANRLALLTEVEKTFHLLADFREVVLA